MKQKETTMLRRVLLTVVVALVTACGGATKIRQAQDYFSQAAVLENQAKLTRIDPADPRPDLALASTEGARAYYAKALAALEAITPEEEEKLVGEKLFITKKTLEAMCHWRLGDFDKARPIAKALAEKASAVDEPRDRIMLIALPGLIKNDRAYRMIPAERNPDNAKFAEVEKELIGPNGALEDLKKAREAAAGRPIDAYLIQSELAVYKNLQNADDKLRTPRQGIPEHKPAIDGLLEKLKELTSSELADLWKRGLG